MNKKIEFIGLILLFFGIILVVFCTFLARDYVTKEQQDNILYRTSYEFEIMVMSLFIIIGLMMIIGGGIIIPVGIYLEDEKEYKITTLLNLKRGKYRNCPNCYLSIPLDKKTCPHCRMKVR